MTATGPSRNPSQRYFRKQDWAYDQVRELILSGELAPGTRVDQETLAGRLGISRIPLREALARLEAEAWLEGQPHRGVVVTENSLDDARDVYAGRIAVESTLASVAAGTADEAALAPVLEALEKQRALIDAGAAAAEIQALDADFHMGVYELARMPKTLSAARTLYSMSGRYVRLYLGEADHSVVSFHEHEQILQAVTAGDAEAAGRLTREHIGRGLATLEQRLYPGQAPATA